MTWFKVDDRFPESDKVIELVLRPEGLAALGVWTLCGSWAAGRGNGGRVTEAVVKRFRGTRKHVSALVAVGLWDASDDEWRFHDWDDYNESAEAAEAVKVAEREAGRRGNHERWHAKRGIVAPSCPFCIGDPNAPDSGGDRVPDAYPESGAIPPGPGPVPDPVPKTDTTHLGLVSSELDAREHDRDELILSEMERIRVRSIERLRRAFDPVVGTIADPLMLLAFTDRIISKSTKTVTSVEAYIERACDNRLSTPEIRDDWKRFSQEWAQIRASIEGAFA